MTRGGHQSRRWLVLGVCCSALFLGGLDTSGLNLALPSIQSDLGASESTLQWIVDAYTMVIAGLLMLSGSVADRIGRRRVFLIGLTVFGLGSVLCACATSGAMLVTCRMVQAVGGSMLNPVAMSIITATFTVRAERARAIGIWGGVIGVSMALGPIVGGLLVQAWGWQSVFWMNAPVVAVAIGFAAAVIPESRGDGRRSLDPVGQVLLTVSLVALMYSIIESPRQGWASPMVVGAVAITVIATVVFVVVESRLREPLVDPVHFSSWPFTGAVCAAVLGFSSMAGLLFISTLYLQSERGLSPFHAGVMTVPMAALTAVCSPLSGRLVASRGPRIPLTAAGVLMAIAALTLLSIDATSSWWVLVVAYAVFGCGFGLLNAPITNSAVSGMPHSRAGVAAGIASTSRQIGNALGVALFGSLTFGAMSSGRIDLAHASHYAWILMGVNGVVIVVIATVITTGAALRSAERATQSRETDK